MSGPRFLFIRHGQTDWNVEGRLQGQTDIPLNPTGRAQARAAGLRAAETLRRDGHRPDEAAFLVSPLGRTRETAEGVRAAMGLDPTIYATDDRLRELSFGEWEGLTWPEVKSRAPLPLKERRRDKWSFVPPKGESYAMLAERVKPVLDTLVQPTVVVSHGGVARALFVLIGGLSRLAAPNTEVLQGHVLRFDSRGYAWI